MTTMKTAALMRFTVIIRLVPIKWDMASFMMTQTLLYVQGTEWNIENLKKGESIKRSNVVTIEDSDKTTFIALKNGKVLYPRTHAIQKV